MNAQLALGLAIVLEVIATTMLKLSDGFARWSYGLAALLLYGVCFYLLAIALKTIPTGIAYAVWSGAGIVLITAVGWLFLGQRLDAPAILGIAMILGGVLVLNVFSSSTAH